jgi:AcrR family transcriptional regulator
MAVKDSKTEQLIKDTAKRIFLKEGRMLATTQDIADAAGVNRTLLHYYFRSRDVLFNMVFKEALANLRERLHSVIGEKETFRHKIEKFLEVFFEQAKETPYLEAFIVLQLNQNPAVYEELFFKLPGGDQRMKNFLKEIQCEMDKGVVHQMNPIHFVMNLFSLMSYPLIAKPIYQNMFNINEAAFNKLFNERKKVILALIFNE